MVALNRAVAVGLAFGPAAGLELVDALGQDASLNQYPWLASGRGSGAERLLPDRRGDKSG